MKNGWTGGISNSHDETINLGVKLSSFIECGDIIALQGGLGTGKTTFTKGIMLGMDYSGSVTSPTYTLINEYHANKKIIHIDCYKENNLSIWISLGLNDYINDNKSIIIVEWPEIINDILPENVITIKMEHISLEKRAIRLI